MVKVITEFDSVSIKNASMQVYKEGVPEAGTPFGCVGSIEGETESKEIVKICEGIEVKKRTIPQKMNLTVAAHVPVQVARDLFGLSNEELKKGVYAYGPTSKGERFVLTADVVDEFEDEVKVIAFPNVSNSTGFQIKIENGQDEVALLEMELTALVDANNKFYYEALMTEVEDAEVKSDWHTSFTPELVNLVPGP